MSTLNNTSSGCSGVGYSNYTALPAPVVYSGGANPISVTIGPGGGDGICAWIDYNQNGNFETSEYTLLGNTNGGNIISAISIPATALTGPTRMRVRVKFGAAFTNAQPCTGGGFAETEDYTVNIQPCVPVTITSSPASASVTCGGNTSFSFAVSGSLPVYSWEWRPNSSSAWFTVTNGGIYSGATTPTLTLTNVTAAYSGYQYRAVVVGGCSATDVSQTATLTVNPIVAVVNPASATICLGAIQQLSLTNTVADPVTTTFTATTGLPLVVPDGSATGILSTPVAISGIPAGSVIKNVAVKFTMTHTWVGDIVMNLKAPNNQVLNLIAALDGGNGGNGTANFTNTIIDSLSTTPMSGAPAPRTGTYRADRFNVGAGAMGVAPTTTNFWAPLLSTINGNWTLAFSDLGAGDVGTLTGWSIAITYVAPNFAQGVWTGPAGTMFTDAGGLTAYTGTPATTIYVKPTITSNYNVSFTTTAPCTSSTATVPVTVHNAITGLAVAPATRVVCVGGNTTFDATVSGGNPVTYQWQQSVDGGLVYTNISGATGATLTLSSVTTSMTGYKYRVVATGGVCGAVTSTTLGTLTVNALPVVTLSSTDLQVIPGQTTSINATSTPAAQATNSWVWSYNGASITTATTNNTSVLSGINVDKLGSYVAKVTDVNGCVNSSAAIVVGAEATDKLWIYPNPTTGNFYIRLYFGGELTETRKVTIYGPTGQLIETRELTLLNTANPYQRMDFNLGGLKAKGSYVVKVVQKNSGKIISGIILVQ
jgi:subtilisin-like proprotein convertase family protein